MLRNVKKTILQLLGLTMKCKTEKQNLHEISRKLKKNPHDLSTRTELFNQKRKFKKLVKTKKCQYKCDTLTKMPIQM